MQTTIGTGRWKRTVEIVGEGVAVVVVRDRNGWTRTLSKEGVDGQTSTEKADQHHRDAEG